MRTRMFTTTRLAVGAIAVALVIAGCGGGDDAPADAPAGTGEVTVEAGDLFYDPETLSATAGEIAFTLVNIGDAEHDLVIEEVGDVVVIGNIAPGETGTGSIELEAGTYTVYCDVPGHREAGMEATLNVS